MHLLVSSVQPLLEIPGRDACGYLASALVFCTFSVRSMRLLRWLGIASNLSFIVYAVLAVTPPILVLHVLLLPMNICRLIQLERDRRQGQRGMMHLAKLLPSRHLDRPGPRLTCVP